MTFRNHPFKRFEKKQLGQNICLGILKDITAYKG